MIMMYGAPFATVLGQSIVVGLRVLGDDVPGVQEAGEETETAQGDVDEGVGAADTAFDPDCTQIS